MAKLQLEREKLQLQNRTTLIDFVTASGDKDQEVVKKIDPMEIVRGQSEHLENMKKIPNKPNALPIEYNSNNNSQ